MAGKFGMTKYGTYDEAGDEQRAEALRLKLARAGVHGEVLKDVPLKALIAWAESLGLDDDDDDASDFSERRPTTREESKVLNHAIKFAETFRRYGQTPAHVVGAYRRERKARPGLTAAEFLGGR